MTCLKVILVCSTHKSESRRIRHFISTHCRPLKLLSDDVSDDIVSYDFDLLFKGQIFESAIFQKFIRDYLTNDHIYGKNNYRRKWQIYIRPWPILKATVNVRHISTINIVGWLGWRKH